MADEERFEHRIERYLGERLGYAAPAVTRARRLAGGVSRETWGIDVTHGEPTDRTETSLVLRLDPDSSLLEGNRHVEFALFRAIEADGVIPVPHAICVEDDPAPLGTTFLATTMLEGTAALAPIATPDYAAARPIVARNAFELLAAIAAFDWRTNGLGAVLTEPSPETAWSATLDHWEAVLERHALGPVPVIRMALRALRRDPPPPPAAVTLVHGDYRLGNILYTETGEITGVLDWEMAHLGDPIEDLAWALDVKWRPRAAADTVFAHYSEEEAIAVYERAHGTRVDRAALRWWSLFGLVKVSIFANTAAHSFIEHEGSDLTPGIVAWHSIGRGDLAILVALGRAGR